MGLSKGLQWLAMAAVLVGVGSVAQAQSFCVYDPAGASGDFYSMARDYQIAAKLWNVSLQLRPYTDDSKLDADFKAGKCDMASMLGMRARAYNKFTGTIDAPGALANYVQVRSALNLMAEPHLARYMVDNGFETVGIVPVGGAYAVTADRNVNTFDKAAGKRIAVMEWDPVQAEAAQEAGVVPVPTQLSQFGTLFNTGKVDIIFAPMTLYKALDMDRGVGTKGGIIRRPLAELTMQYITHAERFPAGFGQHSRQFVTSFTDHAITTARYSESQVDDRVWLYAMHQQLQEWQVIMSGLRERLADKGIYDRRMLSVLLRVRCADAPSESECAAANEQVSQR